MSITILLKFFSKFWGKLQRVTRDPQSELESDNRKAGVIGGIAIVAQAPINSLNGGRALAILAHIRCYPHKFIIRCLLASSSIRRSKASSSHSFSISVLSCASFAGSSASFAIQVIIA